MGSKKISESFVLAVSLIVPVYNVEKYLEKCLNSLRSQTLQNIEIICINDASTDNSGKILDAYTRKDTRMKAIHLKQNAGTLCARLKGIEAACGAFIMFVDSDDELEADACEKLTECMLLHKTDLLHFGTILHPGKNVSKQMLSWVTDFLKPMDGRCEGNLNYEYFVLGRFDFNITNKIWRSGIVKQALPYVRRKKLTASEDRYFAFLLFYFAHSYYGIQDAYYHYNLGIGVTGGDTLSLEQFEKRCTGAAAYRLVLQFLKQVREDGEDYQECAKQFGNKIVWDCVDGWFYKLQPSESPCGFQLLCKYFQPDHLTSAIAKFYFEKEEDVYARMQPAHGTCAAVYDRYLDWENTAEGPIRQWIYDLQQLGYEVFLYTDEERRQKSLDAYTQVYGVPVFYLPDAAEANWDHYEIRAKQLYTRIKKDGIHRLLYASPSSHIAWLDLLLVRLSGADVCRLRDKEQYSLMQQLKQEYDDLETEYQKLRIQLDSPRMLMRRLLGICLRRMSVSRHK